ncbi:MAG: GTPase ObgE [Verrucomicrobiales bacterium]
MFVDHIKIKVRAGNGGNGSAHFHREKFQPKGGPDGGDGGKGGDVVLAVDPHTDNLKTFFYNPKLLAKHGDNGREQRKTGRSGAPAVGKVPAGTIVYREAGDGEDPDKVTDEGMALVQVADLLEDGQRVVIAKGGAGGRGNDRLKSPVNRTPVGAEPGEPGEEGEFYLELRRIADAGMVGFPNAGKSTLVSALSAARPKIGAYPFTTLRPMVGVVEFPGFARCTVADIPGLIEGAHANVGLGHDFLRHIMRCRLLLFVVDTAGSEGRHPVSDLEILRTEIGLYDESLAKQPWLIIANKIDLPEAEENLAAIKNRFPKVEVIAISAMEGDGIEALKGRLAELVGHRPK